MTYIRVVAELLDNRLVEVAGVTLEGVADAESVLHAREELSNVVCELATLAQLEAFLLAAIVDVLDPGVVVGDSGIIDVILELDDVRVRNGIGVDGAQDRSCAIVNGLDAEAKRGGLGNRRSGESESAAHDV